MSKDKITSDGSTAAYYVLPPKATELQHLISHRDMNAQIGEIFRACYRYGVASHSDKLRDAKKIKFYAEAEIARLEAQHVQVEQVQPKTCAETFIDWDKISSKALDYPPIGEPNLGGQL